jgi:hypothetical protein
MNQPSNSLSQAGEFLRTQPEPGWDAIAARVIAAVRTTPRPGGSPLLADTAGGPGQGHIFIRDHVLRGTLAVALRQRYLCAPTSIEFDVEGTALRAVHLEVTGSYGTDLYQLAHSIRVTTAEIITELLGLPKGNRGPIDIIITNVVTGDPLHS